MKALNAISRSYPVALILFTSIILGACRAQTPSAAPTQDINALFTQVAGTLAAEQTQIAALPTNTTESTQTPWVVTATFTSTPEFTATPSTTPTGTLTNTPLAVCNQASFVSDITIPDGVTLRPNTDFTKIWRLRNTGTCTWTTSYKVVFSTGTNMASASSYALSKSVAPGETIDISVPMTSPSSNGTHKGSWMLRSADGANFGLGTGASVAFYVQVKVSSTADEFEYDFAANYCSATWSSNEGTQPCPGSTSSSNGFVTLLTNPKLENRQEDELTLWVHPRHTSNGYLEGIFPNYTVQSGDRFMGWVGCLADYKDCSVRFVLSYIDQNGTRHQIEDWSQYQDGKVAEIDLDLAALTGKTVRFVLRVEVLNTTDYADAQGFWFVPSIRKP